MERAQITTSGGWFTIDVYYFRSEIHLFQPHEHTRIKEIDSGEIVWLH